MKAKKVLTHVCRCVALIVGLTSMLLAYPSGPLKSISEPAAIDPQCPGGKPPPCAKRRRKRTPSRPPRHPAPSATSVLPGAISGSYDDVSTGFSDTLPNPKGVWSYGYMSAGDIPDTRTFQPFKYVGTTYDFFANRVLDGIIMWRIARISGTVSGDDRGLAIFKNVTRLPISAKLTGYTYDQLLTPKASGDTTIFEPNQVSLHPGFGGFFSVIRWIAPKKGGYTLSGDFRGLDKKPTTTDCYLYKNGEKLWWDHVNDFQRPHQFSVRVLVKKGDSIDFIVGHGQDKEILGDTTALVARIYPTN